MARRSLPTAARFDLVPTFDFDLAVAVVRFARRIAGRAVLRLLVRRETFDEADDDVTRFFDFDDFVVGFPAFDPDALDLLFRLAAMLDSRLFFQESERKAFREN